MIKKFSSLILQQFIILTLIMNPVMAADDPTVEERTLEKIDTFLTTSEPSDIPFIDYLETFTTESSQPLKKFDLSTFEGKKIYIGYGVYDKEQNYCRYVEKPGSGDIENYFEKIAVFNKHSYAQSLSVMSYGSCEALAADYGGKPVSITSDAENAFVYSQFRNTTKWIGMERNSCLEEYVNVENKEQDYFNWSTITEQADACVDSKLHAIQGITGTWNKKDKEELHHCIIEVDSEDIKRPIKICAPWWKIERQYEKPRETSFFGVDVYKINQADIPDQITICTRYNEDAVRDLSEQPNRKVTCTSYYDSLIAPECLKNPYQDICYVDECNGYIKNACRKTDTITPFKDYIKAEAIIDGAKKIIKGKVNIKTNVYDCPPSTPSLDNCEEKSTIIVYPQECPGTQCTEYNECILNSASLAEKSLCSTAHPCEKIYPNGDSEKVFNADGSLNHLKAYCADGTELQFEPNLQKKTSKKCLEYETYTIEEEVSQRCELERPYTDHIVDTSITEIDIYMNNPMCIRMNNLVEARPTREVKFDYVNKGFAQTVVKKSYLDGDERTDVQEGGDEDSRSPAMDAENIFSEDNISQATEDVSPPVISACTPYTESWYQKMNNALNIAQSPSGGGSYLAVGIYMDSADTKPYAKYTSVATELTCSQLRDELGGDSYSHNISTRICKVYLPKESADIFSVIKGEGVLDATEGEFPNYTFITKNAITKNECIEAAYCLDGEYNESAFSSSSISQCQVYMGDDYEFIEPDSNELEVIDEIPANTERDENCVPYSTSGGYLSQLDGLQDIYSVQEVVSGDFGYFSNYNAHPFNNNLVKVNEKEVYPLMPIPVINDPLIYKGEFIQTSITTKKPNIAAGAMGGAAAGAGMAAYQTQMFTQALAGFGPIGIAVVVVFVVVAILFGKKQKFNEQRYEWIIYKLVPQERYRQNVYGYDHRTLERNDDDSIYIDMDGNLKLIYAHLHGFTGTLKPGEFKKILTNMATQKVMMLTCMGWMKSEVENIMIQAERAVVLGYPKCKKWSWSCDKRNTQTYTKDVNPFFKRTTNSYVGATNGMSIIVPYLGDYELIAYDQYDNILGQITIKEDDFREDTADVAKYAQVLFGLSMDLADGIDEGNETNACRWDLMTEWGGGVSGIYFENNDTGNNQDCQKSMDGYVKDKAATKISVRATNTDRPHFIDLVKPLPFANRVFLVTLNEKEIREYRCYQDFGECETDEFN